MREQTEIWLRFWAYKIIEILGVASVTFGAYHLGKIIANILKVKDEPMWIEYWGIGIVGIIILIILIFLGVAWVIANWQWAKEDTEARRENGKEKNKSKGRKA